jgi:ABC-type sugar transport system substrate-binding protein
VKKFRCVVAIPGDTMYLREQVAAAESSAARLGVELEVVSAEMDAVAQGQQLLKFVQERDGLRPDAILLEPVSAAGLPRVAEAAVAAGIAWVVSNASVDYIPALRAKAKAPVFLVSQDHVEIGHIQARQISALLPEGGTILYLRGPGMSSIASRRFQGIDGAKPKNVDLKAIRVQGASAEDAYRAVCSWLNLSTGRPDTIDFIFSQNADFILGGRKAFEATTSGPDRSKWLAIPCAGVGVVKQVKPLVDQGVLTAAVLTSLTHDKALEMLVQAIKTGTQPREQTFVEAESYPSLEDLSAPTQGAKGKLKTSSKDRF